MVPRTSVRKPELKFLRCVKLFELVGLSGLEPPTSRLSGVRSNRLSYEPIDSGDHLLSQAASHQVPSTAQVLTVVFGMGTGVSPERIITRNLNDPCGIRTRVTAVKGRCLNPLTNGPQTPRVGFEPTTLRLTAGCSTAELSRNNVFDFCPSVCSLC